MAITEVCQFELKEEVDKMMAVNPGRSLASCIQEMVQFYASAGIELKEETAKKKYQRATQSLRTNVPAPITCESNKEIQEKPSEVRGEHGHFEQGTAPGPGRPQKYEEDSDPLFNLKRWWRKAIKKDRMVFLNWIKEERKS
jgi:hypothetical protein